MDCLQFNNTSNQWESLPCLFTCPNYRGDIVVGAAIDSNRMIVVVEDRTGVNGSEYLTYLYDNRKPSEWTCLPNAPKPEPCAAAAIDGNLVIVDRSGQGSDDDSSVTNNVHMLDTSTMAWKQLPSTRHQREDCTVATCGRYLYAFGGYDDDDNAHKTVERLNITTLEWEDLPTMPTKRVSCAVSVCGDNIIVAGGSVNGVATDVVEVFDTNSLQWSTAPSMPIKSCGPAAVSVVGRYMVVTGGYDQCNPYLDITQVYDSTSRIWNVLPNKMKKGRAWHTAALLGGKQLIIVGGKRSNYTVESMVLPMELTIKGQLIVLRWVVQKRRAMTVDKPAVQGKSFSMVDDLISGNYSEDDPDECNNVIRRLVSGDVPLEIFKIVCIFL